MGKKPSKVLSLCLLTALAPATLFAESRKEIGTVVTTQGHVAVVDPSGVSQEVERRGKLREGDVVVVETDGFVSFRMVDNAHLSLGPATELAFTTYRHDGTPATKDSIVLNLKRGCFRARVGTAGSGRRDDYRVETPVANIAVEASFHGATLVNDSLYTATWDGATVVSNALGSLNLGEYGDYEFSRTFAGEAPKGLAALLPAAACEPPESLDGKLQRHEGTQRTAQDKDDGEG
jgi:hypothetical protein